MHCLRKDREAPASRTAREREFMGGGARGKERPDPVGPGRVMTFILNQPALGDQ